MDRVQSARYEATQLIRFIRSLSLPCQRTENPSYPPGSKELFDYVTLLADETQKHVALLMSQLTADFYAVDPIGFERQAREIPVLRASWYTLHKFIKPALDAHTLESPYGLVDFLAERLRTVPGFERVRFAIIHSTVLNYFQLHSVYVRQLAVELSGIIPTAPPFPKDLAIVGIPYSQATSLFLNTLLAHEMGHFVFQVNDVRKMFLKDLLPILQQHSGQLRDKSEVSRCIDLVVDWLEEIFCDLFAICMIGPAFSHAYIDLLSIRPDNIGMSCGASHPADALRLKEQARLLAMPSLGWWPAIQGATNNCSAVLQHAISIDALKISCGPSPVEQAALSCFLDLAQLPSKIVVSMLTALGTGSQEFQQQKESIQSALSVGVVPSRIIINDAPVIPSGVAIINAGFLFSSESLDDLLKRIRGAVPNCLDCRAFWNDRVEQWVTKALEDVHSNGHPIA